MKKYRSLIAVIICLFACTVFSVAVFAEELTEADRRIFGVFPIWLFILIMAAIVMVSIIVIIEIFKRKQK